MERLTLPLEKMATAAFCLCACACVHAHVCTCVVSEQFPLAPQITHVLFTLTGSFLSIVFFCCSKIYMTYNLPC